MSEAYLTNWLAGHANDERNHFHQVALHEARIATDVHPLPALPARSGGLVDRVRSALTGSARVEQCDCPVAA